MEAMWRKHDFVVSMSRHSATRSDLSRLVIHAAPVALVADHQSAFEIFQVFCCHYVPTLIYVGT